MSTKDVGLPVRSLSNTAALLITGVLALALIAYVFVDLGGGRRDDAPHCVTAQALGQVKAELLRRAAAIRGASSLGSGQFARYLVIRAPSTITRKHHGSASVSCSGTIAVDLPPGTAIVGGRHSLASEVTYKLVAESGGGVRLTMLSNADSIVVPLAAINQAVPATQPVAATNSAQTDESLRSDASPMIRAPAPTETPKTRPVPPPQVAAGSERRPPASHPVAVAQRKTPAPAKPAIVRRTPTAAPGPSAVTSVQPSFNCRSARKQSEIAVCSNPVLANLDRQMATQFFSGLAVARPGQRAMLERSRTRFLAHRNACASEACIADAYQARMREIREIMGGNW